MLGKWAWIVLGAVAAVGAAAGAVLAAGGGKDYGDAPDGTPAGYVSFPQAVGRFPSREASDGARHTRAGRVRLGLAVDRERDSRQIDRDRFDDGFFASVASCRQSTLVFLVDASSLPRSQRTAGHTAYLNAWFDWNRDGVWQGGDRCAREWSVRNLPLDMAAFSGKPIRAVRVKIRGGAQTKELVYRASLTLDQTFASPLGKGLFRDGETEDYRTPVPGGEEGGVDCLPHKIDLRSLGMTRTAFGFHGEEVVVDFVFFGSFGPPSPTEAKVVNRGKLPKDVGIRLLERNGRPTGFAVTSKKDKRSQPVQELTVRIEISAGGRRVRLDCPVIFFHDEPTSPPPKTPPPLPPPPKTPPGPVTGMPFDLVTTTSYDHDPDPQSDICLWIKTRPPRPQALAGVKLVGPRPSSVAAPAERTLKLDAIGEGHVRYLVNEIGDYTLEVTVAAPDGVTRTAEVTVSNASPSGRCSP